MNHHVYCEILRQKFGLILDILVIYKNVTLKETIMDREAHNLQSHVLSKRFKFSLIETVILMLFPAECHSFITQLKLRTIQLRC